MRPSAVSPPPVRSAAKGASIEPDPALVRRSVTAICEITGSRRSAARQQVRAWVAGGHALDDLEAYLRATFRMDPTGVTAVRNVS